jgi:hypothetical protein
VASLGILAFGKHFKQIFGDFYMDLTVWAEIKHMSYITIAGRTLAHNRPKQNIRS